MVEMAGVEPASAMSPIGVIQS